jgi:hypothetical protein
MPSRNSKTKRRREFRNKTNLNKEQYMQIVPPHASFVKHKQLTWGDTRLKQMNADLCLMCCSSLASVNAIESEIIESCIEA